MLDRNMAFGIFDGSGEVAGLDLAEERDERGGRRVGFMGKAVASGLALAFCEESFLDEASKVFLGCLDGLEAERLPHIADGWGETGLQLAADELVDTLAGFAWW